jgi:tRNA nucleotidyltransferase/poly(A) polymerase
VLFTLENQASRIKPMRTPEIKALPLAAQNAARTIALKLREHGIRAWIVGGAVRDLALGLTPKDVDMASSATPAQIAKWFDITHEVGRAFGTVVLLIEGYEVQLTTYRVESGYSDSRRPDEIEFGESLLEDAKRRDFRCNAMYLDPISGELKDPECGLEDIQAGLIRCVGGAEQRFREDGLRLLRMARFAARFGFEIDPETRRAAHENRQSLVGVSAERVLAELTAMLANPGSAIAIRTLHQLELLEVAVPNWDLISGTSESRLAVLEHLADPPGVGLGFAILFGPAVGESSQEPLSDLELVGPLSGLNASKRILKEVSGIGRVMLELFNWIEPRTRAQSIRLLRQVDWNCGLAAARAWFAIEQRPGEVLDRIEKLAKGLGKADLFPDPLLTSADLISRGVEPSPLLGQLLLKLEEAQLNQEVDSTESADAWLSNELRGDMRPQDNS